MSPCHAVLAWKKNDPSFVVLAVNYCSQPAEHVFSALGIDAPHGIDKELALRNLDRILDLSPSDFLVKKIGDKRAFVVRAPYFLEEYHLHSFVISS